MAIAVGGLILALFFRPDSAVSRVLSMRPLAFVGEISYGIYLFHPLLRAIIDRVLGAAQVSQFGLKLLTFPLVLSLSILFAWGHYSLVESYFLSLRDRVVQWSRTWAAGSAVAVREAAEN